MHYNIVKIADRWKLRPVVSSSEDSVSGFYPDSTSLTPLGPTLLKLSKHAIVVLTHLIVVEKLGKQHSKNLTSKLCSFLVRM